MKGLLSFLFLVFLSQSSLSQDSLFVTNHYSVQGVVEKCGKQINQLQCIEEQITIQQAFKPSGRHLKYQFIKSKKALLIYHINASWIHRLRKNYELSLQELAQAELYVDSLKQWESFSEEMEDLMFQVRFHEKQWCWEIYQQDSSAFYTCNCQHFFPELNREKVELTEIKDTITQPSLKTETLYRFGQLISNDTLILAPKFVLDPMSTTYFEKHQTFLLNELTRFPFSEFTREQTVVMPVTSDTLILLVELIKNDIEQTKRCSIVTPSKTPYLDRYYRNIMMQIDFDFPTKRVLFYVPIVVDPVEHANCCNMDRVSLGADHFHIQYEKARPIQPNLPKSD